MSAADQFRAAGKGEFGFALGGNDLQHQAGFARHAFDESFTVGGATAGFGGDAAHMGGMARVDPAGADGERLYRSRHAGIG